MASCHQACSVSLVELEELEAEYQQASRRAGSAGGLVSKVRRRACGCCASASVYMRMRRAQEVALRNGSARSRRIVMTERMAKIVESTETFELARQPDPHQNV